ncbi:MAG: protein phosphatase 2C domain-containing protein [Desulfobacteraceae bacterium]|nr:protein phosphatase 2C domain-containing protein [Desulfobacteraceae bacterium]
MEDNQQIRYATVSDIGLKRTKNEDAYIIEENDDNSRQLDYGGMLFAVADGIGGHACGEVASMMACRGMSGFLDKINTKPQVLLRYLVNRFHAIDDQIRVCSTQNKNCAHMGTTLSTIVITGRTALIAHVGDSRIYRMRNGRLTLLTTDHTFVQEMIDEGELSSEAAATHPFRNMLTLVIGTQEPLERVDARVFDLAAGDRFILSSDGLHDAVAFEEIKKILGDHNNPSDVAHQLLSLALDRGGRDNITIIVIYLPASVVPPE